MPPLQINNIALSRRFDAIGKHALPIKRSQHYLPFVFSVLTIALWAVIAASINSGQFGDNIEQFNWAHGLEWGYWKHPPMPTFILAGAIAIFGNWIYWAYCLSALCFIGTAFFTWKIASKLLGEHAAAITVILLGLHLGFSWRAQIYNHNTVLILLIAVTVWISLLAAESKSAWRWMIAGCLAGSALLSKYQAVVPLLGLLFALQRAGTLKEKKNLRGLLLAICAACLVFLPHFVWLCINDFPTVKYASHSAQNLDAIARGKKLFGFLFYQIRVHSLVLLDLGLVIGYFRFRKRIVKVWNDDDNDSWVSAWMAGLIGFPTIFLVLMLLVGGVNLEDHWGLQTFQFACLWLVWRFKAAINQISIRYFLITALSIHAVAMGLYYRSYVTNRSEAPTKHFDRIFPAQELADRIKLDWQKATPCPLKYVVGPGFEAGMISLYSGSFPAVLEYGDPVKSPWVNLADLAASGSIRVWNRNEFVPTDVVPDGSMEMIWKSLDGSALQTIYWHINLPQQPCNVSAESQGTRQ